MMQSATGSGTKLFQKLQALPCAALMLVVMAAQAQAQSMMTQHVRPEVKNGTAKFLNRLPGTQNLQLDIVLPIRDEAGLDSLLQEVYDPTSTLYHHYLTPQQFTAKFGPTEQDYEDVLGFARAYGLKVVGGSRDSMDVQVVGSVTSIEAAFNVSLGVYQHPTESRTFYSPDREPTAGLPFSLWHVSGLNNFSTPHANIVHSEQGKNSTSNATTGSGPSASFLGSDMRAAYYVNGSSTATLTGSGQYIGLLEYYGYDIADLNTYFTNAGQSSLSSLVTGISTDGTSLTCLDKSGCDDTEQILDMTQSLGMAPGISGLYVFVGSTDTAMLGAMTTHSPLPLQLSSSWTWTPDDPSTDDPYFKKMALQGQSFFQAAGDSSEWKTSTFPSEDPNVICVGGTDLQTTGAAGAWSSETAWSDGGGGISTDKLPIPAYQQLTGVITSANKGSTTYRNGPDVSANSNFTYYVCADQTTCTANEYGGTSFATPLWAGYTALANQQAATNSAPAVGFFNTAVYNIGLGSNYNTDFHDITSGSNGFSAITGFDLATGWGSMNGAALINALTGPPTPTFSISSSPNTLSVVVGSSGNTTINTAALNSFSSAINLTYSGQPSGVTVNFGTNPIISPGTGSSNASFVVASNTTPGTYPITITGTDANTGTIIVSTTVTLTVTTPTFSISPSPSAVSVVQGNTGTSTINTAALNGFSSAINLTYSGQPSGVSVTFGTNPIASPGTGSSLASFIVASNTTPGTYPITITGTDANTGTIIVSTSVSLTVTAPANFTIGASPNAVSVAQGSKGTSTITTAAVGSFDSSIALSASGQPSGVTASFSRSSISAPGNGSVTLTLTVAAGTVTGLYPITVTGTGGGITQTTTVNLTVTVTPSFAVSASPTTVSVAPGSSGGTTVSTTVAGGFNAAVTLSVSGLPSGVTAAFTPSSTIAAPGSGSATLTFTVSRSARAGSHSITVSAKSGSTTHTTTVTLTIT